jgi:hypothetical protein
MAVPWLRLLDAVLGVSDLVRNRRPRGLATAGEETAMTAGAVPTGIEARLAGVVVAALKEAFDRDTRRLELEREQLESERRRAERALQLELARQAGDREIGRLRLLAAIAVASWIGTLFFSTRLIAGPLPARVLLGVGWLLMLAAVALSFTAQGEVARALQRSAESDSPPPVTTGGGQAAPWLVVTGLALVGFAVLVS